jgi:Rrf2 family protein
VPGIIHLGLHDQIIIEVHCHHSFRVGVIFILTSNYLSILLHYCQYAVIIKITSKKKGDQSMKYPTRLSDAVHILAFIALYPDCDLTSDKLAESIQTNPAYVRQLMSALRKGGLLVSVKGHPRPALAREPEKITLLDAYRAVEGNKPLLHQDIHTNPACGVGVNIQLVLRDFYLDIQKTAEQKMQEITLKDVLEQYHMKLEGTLLQRL